MTKREKLLARIRNNPKNVRFDELEGLIVSHGFEKAGSRGSHNVYVRDTIVITLVRPHGSKKFCHPLDVKDVLEALSNGAGPKKRWPNPRTRWTSNWRGSPCCAR